LVTGDNGWKYGFVYDDYRRPNPDPGPPAPNVKVRVFEVDQAGQVRAYGFITLSSKELKKDIAALTFPDASTLLLQLAPVRFKYKNGPGGEHLGFIAEDMPEGFSPDSKSVDAMQIVAAITRVVQELHVATSEQKRELQALRQEICSRRWPSQEK
jgi:hypothetical protein